MRHHFQDHRYGFGVTSPFWDAVFRTLPCRKSERRRETESPQPSGSN